METDRELELWDEPRVTGNSNLLTGYIAGALYFGSESEDVYKVVSFRPFIVETIATGNRFEIDVKQISGIETWLVEEEESQRA